MTIKKKTLLLFSLLSILATQLYAQKQGQALIDSLLQQLPHTKEDTFKVKLLNAISYNYFFVNPGNGITYGRQALSLAQRLNWLSGIATADKNIGNSYMGMSSFDSAFAAYNKALSVFVAIDDKDGEARVLGNMGSIYDDKGDYARALEYEFRALKIYEDLRDKKGLIRIYGTIGSLYETPKKYRDAIHYDSMALALSLQIGDEQSAAINMGNMGNSCAHLNNYDKALDLQLRSLKIFEQLKDSDAIANKLSNIGDLYVSMNAYSKALEYAFSALRVYEHTGDKQGIAITLGNIGGKYIAIVKDTTGKIKPGGLIPDRNTCLQKAITYLQPAAKIFEETGDLNELYGTYEELAQLYLLSGDIRRADQYDRKYKDLRDSIFQSSAAVKFANLEKDKVIRDKEKQEELSKLVMTNGRYQLIFFITTALLLLIIIALVVRQRRRSDTLLTNILPQTIADRLKRNEHPIADHFDNASIMFADMVGFTKFSDHKNPKMVVNVLNDVFTRFDALAEKYGLEKIKTIGDCYMAVAGVPQRRSDHANIAANMALEIRNTMKGYAAPDGTPINFRIGLHCGPVVAGVIGKKKFIYDLWGDAVNTASRMESSGLPGEIHCSDEFKNSLSPHFVLTDRGNIEVKSKGVMHTWFLMGHKSNM